MEGSNDALQDLREYATVRRIRPLTALQRKRSEAVLSSHINELRDILEIGRMSIDREVHIMYSEDPRPRIFHGVSPRTYPTGHCELIRDSMMEYLMDLVDDPVDRKLPALQAIGQIARQGIPIGKVHGVIDYGTGKAFQNAIQMGHLILDGAMNTISGHRQNVGIYDIDSGILRNIDDYSHYAKIVRDYWGMTVSSTAKYLPNLAALFPFILTNRASGKVEFAKYSSLFFMNIEQDLRLSEEIAQRADEFDELPPKARESLRAKFRNERGWFEWCESKTQLADVFHNHRMQLRPLLKGSDEQARRKTLDQVVRAYDVVNELN